MNGIPCSTHVHREEDVKEMRHLLFVGKKREENQDKSVTQRLDNGLLLAVFFGVLGAGEGVQYIRAGVKSCECLILQG